jgi:hypothetical protein
MLEDVLLNMINAAYPLELKILNETARARVIAAIKAQRYYDGDFWHFIEAERSEWCAEVGLAHKPSDYGRLKAKDAGIEYAPSRLTLNYPKYFIDEVASWMFEKPLIIQGDDEPRNRVMKVHEANMLDEKYLQGAGESALTGGVAVKVLWNEVLGKTRVLVRPSRECFPIFDPDDIDILEKVHFCAIMDDEKTIWRQTFEIQEGFEGIKGSVCCVTDAYFKVEELKKKNPKPFRFTTIPLFANGEPIDFIPVVPIPNEPNLGDIWGKSDLVPLYTPINELCRKISDFSDAVAFEMFPITIFKNVEWDQTAPIKAAPGAFLNINGPGGEGSPEADAYKLEAQMSAKPSVDWLINQFTDMLHQWSGVPNITRDKLDTMGEMSGVAMRLMYLAIISKCNRKLKYWVPRLGNVYDMVLKTESVYSDYNYVEDYELTIEPQTKLPENEMEEAQITAIKVGQLWRSIETAMKKDGVKDPEKEFARILAEQKLIADSSNPDIIGAALGREDAAQEQQDGF